MKGRERKHIGQVEELWSGAGLSSPVVVLEQIQLVWFPYGWKAGPYILPHSGTGCTLPQCDG